MKLPMLKEKNDAFGADMCSTFDLSHRSTTPSNGLNLVNNFIHLINIVGLVLPNILC